MIRVFATCALVAVAGPAWAGECAPDRLDIRGDFGAARFTIELADDFEERAKGLMFRESIAASQGMLFLYDTPGAPAFWMKNTLIPLDMLFLTPTGTVQWVHPMAVPGDLSPISGGDNVIAVLEIKGGLAGMMGIEPGSQVRYPGFDPAVADWPCETEATPSQ